MRVYIAATFADKPFARQFADKLAKRGYACCSRWVFAEDDEEGLVGDALPPGSERFADEDIEDVRACDALVLLTGDSDSPGKSGEAFGAMLIGKPVFPVGDRQPRTIFRTKYRPLVSVAEFLAEPFGGEL